MNIIQFKYAIEVERTGSISQAAENLYMAQPNLSKAIRELEENLGFTVFERTSRGVVPTRRGVEFLKLARGVLLQVEQMEALRDDQSGNVQRLSLSMPRGSYIACLLYTSFPTSVSQRIRWRSVTSAGSS